MIPSPFNLLKCHITEQMVYVLLSKMFFVIIFSYLSYELVLCSVGFNTICYRLTIFHVQLNIAGLRYTVKIFRSVLQVDLLCKQTPPLNLLRMVCRNGGFRNWPLETLSVFFLIYFCPFFKESGFALGLLKVNGYTFLIMLLY